MILQSDDTSVDSVKEQAFNSKIQHDHLKSGFQSLWQTQCRTICTAKTELSSWARLSLRFLVENGRNSDGLVHLAKERTFNIRCRNEILQHGYESFSWDVELLSMQDTFVWIAFRFLIAGRRLEPCNSFVVSRKGQLISDTKMHFWKIASRVCTADNISMRRRTRPDKAPWHHRRLERQFIMMNLFIMSRNEHSSPGFVMTFSKLASRVCFQFAELRTINPKYALLDCSRLPVMMRGTVF